VIPLSSNPLDIAELVEIIGNNIKTYCADREDLYRNKVLGDPYINCLLEHSPRTVEYFLLEEGDYYGNNEEIRKILENGDSVFWKSFKNEYEKKWMSMFANVIAEGLQDQIQWVYESIIEDDSINDEEKKNRLEKLNNVLDELGKAILDALKSQTPLKANQILKYADDIAKNAGGSYINVFKYYLDYYAHSLNGSAKLEVLARLLDSFGNIMYDIDKKINEYNSQQLTY
jgi:hypothetical protein